MTLLVDTSVRSPALRRDATTTEPEVDQLKDTLLGADGVALLSTDNDFKLAAPHCSLRLWAPKIRTRRK